MAVGYSIPFGICRTRNRWRDLNILAYRNTGKLTVEENAIEFNGGKETVVIANIQRVTFGNQGRDFINSWVKIEYGDSTAQSIAFFADGSFHGWSGIFGGTKRILEAVKQHVDCDWVTGHYDHDQGNE